MENVRINRGFDTLGNRLRRARIEAGHSTRTVAGRLSKYIAISHVTLSNYERDISKPTIDVLAGLARLYDREITWFMNQSCRLTGVHYRNLKSKVGIRKREQFEGECLKWLEAYSIIEDRFSDANPECCQIAWDGIESPHELARRIRCQLGYDEDKPILSVIDLIESLGVRVIEIETDLSIDGVAAKWGDEYVIVLNSNLPNDRVRLTAVHELGHVLFGDCDIDGETLNQEKRAFEFASRLLLTNSMLKSAFRRKSVVDMVRHKERYGISLSAMVYRAEHENIISSTEAKKLWIEFSKRGWRSREPGNVWADRATRFEAIMDEALVLGESSVSEMAALASVREDELRRRLSLAIGADDYDVEMEESPTEGHLLRIVR